MALTVKDDELLQNLARAAREHREEELRQGDAWDAQTEQVLTDLGDAAFDDEFQAGVLSRLSATIPREVEENHPKTSTPPPTESAWAGPQEDVAAAGWLPAGWLRWASAAVLASVLALAWASLSWRGSRGEGPLPAYTLAAAGISAERSAAVSEERVVVAPGYRFEVRLKPESPSAGKLAARVYRAGIDGQVELFTEADAKIRVLESGAVVLDGLDGDAWQPLAPGDHSLYFLVGRPGSLPSPEELGRRLRQDPLPESPDWRLLIQEIRLVETG